MGTLVDNPRVAAFRGLSGAERDAAYMKVERVRRHAEALLAAMIGDVNQTVSYADDGHRNTASWVQAVTNCSRREAAARVATARMIRDLPAVGDALADGDLGPSQTAEFTRLHGNDRARPHLPDSTAILIEHACLLPHHDFRIVCQRFEQHADPDGAHHDHETSRHNRHVTLSPDGAGFHLKAEGDALSGAIVEEVLDAFTTAEFDLDWAAGKAVHGDKMSARLMTRTARQRRYDALIKICRRAAEATATNPLQPLVNIFCDEQTLTDAIRSHTGHTRSADRSPEPAEFLSRRCQTASGAPVDPNDLAIAALTGRIRRIVTDGAGRVIDLGRRRRLFTGAAREAVLLAGDRCSWPGCNIRAGRIHVDHTLAWAAELGHTNPANGGPDCPHHNLRKEHGFTQVRNPAMPGGWITYRHDGTRIGIRTSPATTTATPLCPVAANHRPTRDSN